MKQAVLTTVLLLAYAVGGHAQGVNSGNKVDMSKPLIPDSAALAKHPDMFYMPHSSYYVIPEDKDCYYAFPAKRIDSPTDSIRFTVVVRFGTRNNHYKNSIGYAYLDAYDYLNPEHFASFSCPDQLIYGKTFKRHMKFKFKAYAYFFPPVFENMDCMKTLTVHVDYYPFERGKTTMRYKLKRTYGAPKVLRTYKKTLKRGTKMAENLKKWYPYGVSKDKADSILKARCDRADSIFWKRYNIIKKSVQKDNGK